MVKLSRMKGRSILEATTVFAIFMLVTTMIPGVMSLIRWEGRNLGGSYFTGILIVVLTVVASIVTVFSVSVTSISSFLTPGNSARMT